jgi:hypothetical protein
MAHHFDLGGIGLHHGRNRIGHRLKRPRLSSRLFGAMRGSIGSISEVTGGHVDFLRCLPVEQGALSLNAPRVT